MFAWVLLVVATCAAVEVAIRLPLLATVQRIVRHSKRSAIIIRAKAISDHWKEKSLQLHALRIFKYSLLLFAFIVMIVAPFFLLNVLSSAANIKLSDQLLTLVGTLASVSVAFAYITLRRRFLGE